MLAAVTVCADVSSTPVETVKRVFYSTIETSAPLCPLPITRSISQLPTLLLSSTTSGRSSILIRFLINPLPACLSLLGDCYVITIPLMGQGHLIGNSPKCLVPAESRNELKG